MSPGLVFHEVERRPDLTLEDFRNSYLAQGRAVVLEGAALNWPAISLWTSEYLHGKVGAQEVEVSRLDPVDNPDADTGDRAVSVRERISVSDFLDGLSGATGQSPFVYVFQQSLFGGFRVLLGDVLIPDYLPSLSQLLELNVWLAPGGHRSRLHFDLKENFLVQVTGRKSVALVEPAQFQQLESRHHMTAVWRQSPCDLRAADALKRWPTLSQAKLWETLLEPGDVLFMPAFWWHDVLSPEHSTSVNMWWRAPLERCPNEGVRRYVCRDEFREDPLVLARGFDVGEKNLSELFLTYANHGETGIALLIGDAGMWSMSQSVVSTDVHSERAAKEYPDSFLNLLRSRGIVSKEESSDVEWIVAEAARVREVPDLRPILTRSRTDLTYRLLSEVVR